MSRFAPLPLKMHDGRPLPHTFFEGDGAGLLIIFPGLHYGPDGPLLYHLSKRLQGVGWDTLGLTYGFQAKMAFPWTEHVPEILAEGKSAAEEAMSRRAYPRLSFVGKSLGSIVLVQLCSVGVVPDKALVAQLTPPIGSPQFDSAFAATRPVVYIAASGQLLQRRPLWQISRRIARRGPGDQRRRSWDGCRRRLGRHLERGRASRRRHGRLLPDGKDTWPAGAGRLRGRLIASRQ
jgi:hypothetical protein